MSEPKQYIYIIQNKVNKKIYIGQTNDPDYRWRRHQSDCKNPNTNSYYMMIGRAIRKYGADSFDFSVLEECVSLKEANNAEEFWIQYLNTQNKDIGYNIKSGGDNHKQSDETKRKIGAGNSIALKGKKHSEEHNKNISRGLSLSHNKRPHGYKLTSEDVSEVKKLYDAGYTQIAISKQFNIDQSYVSKLVNNKK